MDVLTDKIVTTRKLHYCHGCAREMPIGSRLKKTALVDAGEFQSSYWCDTCVDYWAEYMTDDDSINMGDLRNNDPRGWEEFHRKRSTE